MTSTTRHTSGRPASVNARSRPDPRQGCQAGRPSDRGTSRHELPLSGESTAVGIAESMQAVRAASLVAADASSLRRWRSAHHSVNGARIRPPRRFSGPTPGRRAAARVAARTDRTRHTLVAPLARAAGLRPVASDELAPTPRSFAGCRTWSASARGSHHRARLPRRTRRQARVAGSAGHAVTRVTSRACHGLPCAGVSCV
jgi:hypothetical protein